MGALAVKADFLSPNQWSSSMKLFFPERMPPLRANAFPKEETWITSIGFAISIPDEI
jgi:hypothetical protein